MAQPNPPTVTGAKVELSPEGDMVLLILGIAPTEDTPGYNLAVQVDADTSATLGGQFLVCAGAVKAKPKSPLTLVRGPVPGLSVPASNGTAGG